MRRFRFLRPIAAALVLPGFAACAGLGSAGAAGHTLGATPAENVAGARPESSMSLGGATDSVWVFTNRAREDGRWRSRQGEVQRLVRVFRVTPARRDSVRQSARLHVQAAGERLLDAEAMQRAVQAALDADPHSALVLHVHGYATSLDEAAVEAAEMRHRGGFAGPMAVFSWPARAIGVTWPAPGRFFTNGYWKDSLVAEASVDDFVRVLHELVALAGANRLVVSAHSMGNQLLAQALQRADVRVLLSPVPLRAIAFASPDLARDWFHGAVVPAARPLADRLVLYGARNDHMLRLSALVHGGAGRAGLLEDEHWLDTPGLEVVDITNGCVAMPRFGAVFDSNHAFRRHGTALADLFGNVAAEAPVAGRIVRGPLPECLAAANRTSVPR